MAKRIAKKWDTAKIKFKLETNNEWLLRGLCAIYDKQTEDEKSSEVTKHDNGIGFNGADANFLSSLARQYRQRGFLTANQITLARKAMMKYAGQLCKIANGEIA